MQCYIGHSNYNQFEKVYGDAGVNYIHSQLLDIPLANDVQSLESEIQDVLNLHRINKTKEEIQNNLKQIFGDDLKDSDIQFITNLGSSIAKFKASGEILFNDLELQNRGVEYHEAFHKIFRMYIEDSERKKIYDEVRKLNPSKPWTKYTQYKTEEEQIEELIADDFMTYAVNKNYKDKSMLGKLFFRILKFIKEVFSRPERLDKIYDKILNGGYAGSLSSTPLLEDANKFIVTYTDKKDRTVDIELSEIDKNAAVNELLNSFTNKLFEQDPYALFQDKTFNVAKLLTDMLSDFSKKTNLSPEFREIIKNNFIKIDGQIKQEFIDRLNTLGIGLTIKTITPEEDNIDEDDDTNQTSKIGKDNDITAFDVPSFQVDPNNMLSQIIRLRLSTLVDGRIGSTTKGSVSINKVNSINTYNNFLRFGEVMKNINKILAKSPADIDVMVYLIKLKAPKYISDAIVPIVQDQLNKDNSKFITDFVSTLAKTNYNFGRALITKDGFKIKELTFGLPQAKLIRDIANSIADSNYKKDDTLNSIATHLPSEHIGSTKEQKDLIRQAIFNINNHGLHGVKVKDVIIALNSLASGETIESFSDFKGNKEDVEKRKLAIINLREYFRNYAKLIVAYEGLEETMHLTVDGKPMYDISLDTTQSKTIKILEFIQTVSPNEFTGTVKYDDLVEATKVFEAKLSSDGFEVAITELNKTNLARYVLLNKYLPHLINTYTFTNEKGMLVNQSILLKAILRENITPTLMVIDGIIEQKSGSNESKNLGEMSSAELNMYYINNLFNDVYDTIKHSDRSTFFGYIMKDKEGNKKSLFPIKNTDNKNTNIKTTVDILTDRLMNAEKSYYQSIKNSDKNYQSDYFMRKEGKKLIKVTDNTSQIDTMRNGYDEMIKDKDTLKNLKKYFDGVLEKRKEAELFNQVKSQIEKWIVDSSINTNSNSWKNNMIKDNILKKEGGLVKANKIYSSYIPENGNIDNVISYAFCNAILFHMEEQIVVYGHFNQYKNADDLYKRMNTHSGTGRTFDVSSSTNEKIADETNETYFNLYDVNNKELINDLIYNKYEKSSKPKIVLTTLAEYENYYTHDKDQLKKDLTKSLGNLAEVLKAEGLSDKKIKDRIEKQLNNFTGAYEGMNMPDGQSYCSMFFFKEYKTRLGEWTDDHEMLFKAELKILAIDPYQSEDVIEQQKNKILKTAFTRLMNKKNLDNEEQKIAKRYTLEDIIELHLHSFEVLKPQYGGPSADTDYFNEQDFDERVFTYEINKTSIFPMLPSVVIGTNLSKLNSIMLKEGVDLVSMQSATKTGAINYKLYANKMQKELDLVKDDSTKQILLDKYGVKSIEELKDLIKDVSKNGLEVYNDKGDFNNSIQHIFKSAKQYIQFEYFKDQVKIHDHPKVKITNSTQSMKNILANCYVLTKDGKLPADLIKEYNNGKLTIKEWESMSEEDREERSNLYKFIKLYTEALRNLVVNDLNKLLEEVQYDKELDRIQNFDRFKKILIESAKGRNSPKNLIETLELFADPENEKILETLSNKTKIEPIIYSLVNKIINFKRPGNSVPMLSSQMLESIHKNDKGSRDRVSNTLKSYKINEKNMLEPAEIILPLPRSLFNKVIKAVNTEYNLKLDNILDALPLYNKLLENGKREFITKGLRIPNQQYSSNDVLKVKKFMFPSLESFVLVYADIVAKTGGDFDIDKLNMFFYEYDNNMMPILTEEQVDKDAKKSIAKQAAKEFKEINGYKPDKTDLDIFIDNEYPELSSKSYAYNRILDAELKILSQEVNYWQMMMPIVDDYLKNELLPFMESKIDKWEEQYPDISYIRQNPNSGYSSALTPSTNIMKTILYLQGKAGVGIFALQGTGHAISGYTPIHINDKYKGKSFKITDIKMDKKDVELLTSLPLDIKFYNNHISSITTKDGRVITEIISQLLTSQVDIGKNPYPASMGLLLENLTIISYGLRRGVPLEVLLQLVQHPVVKIFNNFRSEYESLYSKSQRMDIGRDKIIKAFFVGDTKKKIESQIRKTKIYLDVPTTISRVEGNEVKLDLKEDAKGFLEIEDGTEKQKLNILLSYFQMLEQSSEYSKFIRYSRFDTQTFKDKVEYESWKKIRETLTDSQFFSTEQLKEFEQQSLISPFKEVKDNYSIFNHMYYEERSEGFFKHLNNYFYTKNTKERENLERKLNSAFITYLVQTAMPDYLKDNNLLKDSLARNLNSSNIKSVINEFITDINKYKKNKDKGKYFFEQMTIYKKYHEDLGAFFTKNRVRNVVEINDIIESLKEIELDNKDVFQKIMLLPFLTVGTSVGRFNYQDILPQELRYDLIYNSIVDSLKNDITTYEFDFLEKFVRENMRMFQTAEFASDDKIAKLQEETENPDGGTDKVEFFLFPFTLSDGTRRMAMSRESTKGLANYAKTSNEPTVQLPVGQKQQEKEEETTKQLPEVADKMKVFYNLDTAKEELDANKAKYKVQQDFGVTKIYNKNNKLIATYNSLGKLATTAQLKDVTIDDMAKDLHNLACE